MPMLLCHCRIRRSRLAGNPPDGPPPKARAFRKVETMPLFVIEIGGEPILVFPEDTLALAQEEADTGNVTEALQEFERNGAPVWDGEAKLTVRAANADETAHYDAGFAEAMEDGEVSDEDRDEFAVFLIETDDGE